MISCDQEINFTFGTSRRVLVLHSPIPGVNDLKNVVDVSESVVHDTIV